MSYNIGENPGIGTYKCIYSGHTVYLDNEDDDLPPCPSNDCTATNPSTIWVKIG